MPMKNNVEGISPDHKPTGNIYEINSFEDFNSVVNEQNVDILFANMFASMKAFIEFKKAHPELKYTGFKWHDDGKMDMLKPTINLEEKSYASIIIKLTDNKNQPSKSDFTMDVDGIDNFKAVGVLFYAIKVINNKIAGK